MDQNQARPDRALMSTTALGTFSKISAPNKSDCKSKTTRILRAKSLSFFSFFFLRMDSPGEIKLQQSPSTQGSVTSELISHKHSALLELSHPGEAGSLQHTLRFHGFLEPSPASCRHPYITQHASSKKSNNNEKCY